MASRKFVRKIEDFDCDNCGVHTLGDGYTNHCPQCLWSKHVDINPGDRASACGGLMQPVGAIIRKGGDDIVIVHECAVCGFRRNNRKGRDDDMGVVIALSARPVREPFKLTI